MTQEQRLDYLIEQFKEDSGEYALLQVGRSGEEKRRALRSLMNIRMPRELDEETLRVQDEYLTARAEERGVVTPEAIPPVSVTLQSRRPFADRIAIWQGDITRLACDAIVNAANSQMLGCFAPLHACIDNCIHTFAGLRLRNKCAELTQKQGHEEPTGQAKLTPAYNLPCKYVIHTVGPIVQGALTDEHRSLLKSCYRSCLELANRHGLESIVFCCISTGVFMFPNDEAAHIAVDTVKEYLDGTNTIKRVVFNVFKDIDKEIYSDLLAD